LYKINYLIRAKNLDSNGFLQTLHLSFDGEMDIDVDKILSPDTGTGLGSRKRKSPGSASLMKSGRG